MNNLSSKFKKLDMINDDFSSFYNFDQDFKDAITQELEVISEFYSQKELIAEGGMKKVLKVFDNRCHRFIALAQSKDDLGSDYQGQLLREARLTASLNHPNIIKVFDIYLDENGRAYFTMDLKDGLSLAELIEFCYHKQQPKDNKSVDLEYFANFPQDRFLEIFLKICDAVAYAHSQGIVHLDLKPSNVQVGYHGEVMVCDWGLAKVIDPSLAGDDIESVVINSNVEQVEKITNLNRSDILNNFTYFGEIKGTPGYMSFEQANRNKTVTRQSDIYALGAILYSMMTGILPQVKDFKAIINETKAGNIALEKLYGKKGKKIPKSLYAVVKKAMSTKSDSYSCVNDLKDDIEKYRTGFATGAENANFYREARLFYTRNRHLCLIILAALILIFSSLVFFLLFLNTSRLQLIQQEQQTKSALTLYQRESAWFDNLYEVNLDSLTRLCYINPSEGVLIVLKRLDKMLSKNSDDKTLLGAKGTILFIMQDFDNAVKFLKNSNYYQASFTQLAEKYSRKQKNQQENLLSADDMVSLIKELSKDPNNLEITTKLVVYYVSMVDNFAKTAPVVKQLLQNVNKNWNADNGFYFDSKNNILYLKGNGLEKLGIGSDQVFTISYLAYCNIRKLVIDSADFNKLDQLKGANFDVLDISNCAVNSAGALFAYKNITKKLIIRKRQISKTDIKRLKSDLGYNVSVNTKATFNSNNVYDIALWLQESLLNINTEINNIDGEVYVQRVRKVLRVARSRIYFIRQDFGGALFFIRRHSVNAPKLKKLSEKYKNLPTNTKGVLKGQYFIEFIKDIKKENFTDDTFERVIAFHLYRLNNFGKSMNILREILKLKNPEWDSSKFKYDNSKNSLVVSGDNLNILGVSKDKWSYLQYCNINTLVIDVPSFGDLRQLGGANLDVLDISKTNVSNVSAFFDNCQITKKLLVREGQLPDFIITRLTNMYNIQVQIINPN
ncbi:serine/threonine-protein kinase [Lentisphaerota bacterium WC36G]|nr:serine/threonine protein kinase [Lentisphaerae bacterium WC36]